MLVEKWGVEVTPRYRRNRSRTDCENGFFLPARFISRHRGSASSIFRRRYGRSCRDKQLCRITLYAPKEPFEIWNEGENRPICVWQTQNKMKKSCWRSRTEAQSAIGDRRSLIFRSYLSSAFGPD